jgi:drug/metabolite transporter (DMT)-like permease
MLLNYLLFSKTATRYMLAAILATCVGAAFTVNEAAKTQALGIIIATLAFCSTARYQIWIGKTRCPQGEDAETVSVRRARVPKKKNLNLAMSS